MCIPSQEERFKFMLELAHPILDEEGKVVKTVPNYFYNVEYDLKLFIESIEKETTLPTEKVFEEGRGNILKSLENNKIQ